MPSGKLSPTCTTVSGGSHCVQLVTTSFHLNIQCHVATIQQRRQDQKQTKKIINPHCPVQNMGDMCNVSLMTETGNLTKLTLIVMGSQATCSSIVHCVIALTVTAGTLEYTAGDAPEYALCGSQDYDNQDQGPA